MNYDETVAAFEKGDREDADRIEEEIQGNAPISVPFESELEEIRLRWVN